MEAVNDYKMIQSQKLRYFHNLFEGEAKQFYGTYVKAIYTSFMKDCSKLQN